MLATYCQPFISVRPSLGLVLDFYLLLSTFDA